MISLSYKDKEIYSTHSYEAAKRTFEVTEDKHVTKRAEQQASKTGKLGREVDPAVNVIKRSMARFVDSVNGSWKLGVGCPMDISILGDTTGSMGGNVDALMLLFPDTYTWAAEMLPEYDVQVQLGIFGDADYDNFPLQLSEYEFTGEKFVKLMTEFVPEREGGDTPEDPQYGLFAAAYLTWRYTNQIGLKGYHFLVSDASAHDRIETNKLRGLFGKDVFTLTEENGHIIDPSMPPDTKDVIRDLKKSTHAFFLQIGDDSTALRYWLEAYGRERVISLGDIKYLPHVEAAIIGLTEGTLQLEDVESFLKRGNLQDDNVIAQIKHSLANIPLGAQAELRAQMPRPVPKRGDTFAQRTDPWPTEMTEVADAGDKTETTWL